jgi:ABC-2 type transport system permease protein
MATISTTKLPDSVANRLQTWWTVLRICIEERLVYRGDFALGTLMRFLPIVTQVFLWTAVFASNRRGDICGYSAHDMVAYYLLTMIVRAFSSMPGLAGGISRQIRSGEIKKFLTQPIDMVSFLFLSRVAHKLVYYFVATAPFAFVFYICRGYFTNGWPDAMTLVAFVLSTLLSFVLGFFLEATLGMIGFWFLEVSSLLFVYMLLNFFLSGHMFPLDLLPEPLAWLRFSPLAFLAYFPAAVFLGKITGHDLAVGLAFEVFWTVLFIVLCRWALVRGLKRYSAYGG